MVRALVLGLALVLLFGCAAGSSRYAEEMDALIGKADKKTFVDRYGLPDKQAAVDATTEVWEYRLNEQKYTSATGYRFSTFDRLRLSFKDGRLYSWSREAVME